MAAEAVQQLEAQIFPCVPAGILRMPGLQRVDALQRKLDGTGLRQRPDILECTGGKHRQRRLQGRKQTGENGETARTGHHSERLTG
jgi:hypothetical protein